MKKLSVRALVPASMMVMDLVAILALGSCTSAHKYANLRKELSDLVRTKDAKIGVAVIIDGKDTVAVNGNEKFPMLSVYKFPIALALAEEYRQHGFNFSKPLHITVDDLHPDTYSPMTEKILASSMMVSTPVTVPTAEILKYMLQQSDNNASDIVLKTLNGPGNVMRFLREMDIADINIISTEAEMHDDPGLCYRNSCTPLAIARLIDRFDTEYDDALSKEIKRLMESCTTGTKRLASGLPANVIIGHKTGTGFTMPDGTLMAVNDAGYVHLPGARRYTIAAFIADSHYSMEETEKIIAEISRLVFTAIMHP